jgi:diadenylate cyclase
VPMPGFIQYLLGPGTTWREVLAAFLDVAVVSFLVYRVLLLIRGTRAIHVLVGLFLLGIGYLGSQWANLITLNWLLGHFLTYSFIFGVIVLFQADIRRGLAQLGRGRFLSDLAGDDGAAHAGLADAVARAAADLSRRRHGALIVLERTADLGDVIESGVRIDAACAPELLLAVFQPGGALHDGAVVIQHGRVAAASCLLPLTSTPTARDLGTRHRAALGLAEEVDAAVVIVSEERGEISLAVDGALHRGLDDAALRQLLARLLAPVEPRGLSSLLGRFGVSPPQRAPKREGEDHRAAG